MRDFAEGPRALPMAGRARVMIDALRRLLSAEGLVPRAGVHAAALPLAWIDVVSCAGIALVFAALAATLIGRRREQRLRRLADERGAALEAARRDLAAALERAEGLVQLEAQLLANVSHELRTPLALILGPTERLLGGSSLDEAQRADLEVVARNARSLLKHVSDLLDVAKSDAGKLDASYSEVDVSDLVRATCSHFDTFAGERRIAYAVDAAPALPAELDAEKLQRVLINLLANAFKYTPVGGRVRCAARAVGSARVAIEVADSGPGVPPAQREAVFERFRQLEGGATRRFGGTGLGLAIVKDFVEVMDGSITIDVAPEGGALFRVELPCDAPPGAVVSALEDSAVMSRVMLRDAVDSLRAPPEPPPHEGDAPRPLVLVVEDNPDMNRFVAATLSEEFRVATAPDGRAGLERAIELRPDLIVSDMMMPGLGGDELVHEVRKRPDLDGVPIVLLTAKIDDDLRVRLLREGAQDYLGKPFFAEELRARVGNLVSMKRTRDILQGELLTHARDLESLARQMTRRGHELETALESARVARDAADQASRMKTGFLRMVSHELRTPLTSLKLNLDRLRRDRESPLTARQEEIVCKVASASDRLMELIESLLEYARIESGHLEIEVTEVDLAELAASVIEELGAQAEQKGIALHLARAPGLPRARSDARLLRLVLVNLVGNAVKFTREGGVDVSLSAAQGEHQIVVRDTGPGIPAEDHERIFEPFEQMEAVVHKHTPGVGLGLSIVREMVDALGGRIELRSTVGEGSVFTVAIPEGPVVREDALAGSRRLSISQPGETLSDRPST